MSSMKKTKEGVNLKKKKFLRLKNTGSILVLMGLLIIFVIALSLKTTDEPYLTML